MYALGRTFPLHHYVLIVSELNKLLTFQVPPIIVTYAGNLNLKVQAAAMISDLESRRGSSQNS